MTTFKADCDIDNCRFSGVSDDSFEKLLDAVGAHVKETRHSVCIYEEVCRVEVDLKIRTIYVREDDE